MDAKDSITQREWICRCSCCGVVYDYHTVKGGRENAAPAVEQTGTEFTAARVCRVCGCTKYFIMGIVESVERVFGFPKKQIPVPKPPTERA